MNGYQLLLSAFARWIVLESPYWWRYYAQWNESYRCYVTHERKLVSWAWRRCLSDQQKTGEEL